jgi:hypothetical protein
MEFRGFPKIPRLKRGMVITEKIDGTNGLIAIDEDGAFRVGSRTRWITPEDDNFGFARWAYERRDELMELGPGFHYGEWWGQGIQRRYGLQEKRFSLFNVGRWNTDNPSPACCWVVPILDQGDFNTYAIEVALTRLREEGSAAAPGFMKPEGVIVYHVASRSYFKRTLEKDEEPKGMRQAA